MAYQNIYIDSRTDTPTVYVWDDQKGLVTLPLAEFSYAYEKDPKGKHITMTGERVTKTRRFTRGHPNVFESDLPRETRVLTDLYLNDDAPSEGCVPLFFDIEVSTEGSMPDTNDPVNEITSIALYDPQTKVYQAFIMDKERLYVNRITPDQVIWFCASEVDLLHKFLTAYEAIQPTIITGWNSNRFDVPYLYNRMRQVCGPATANRLSPIGKVKWSEKDEKYKIAGVSSLDYYDLYRKFTYTQQPNYRLDTIGKVELGEGKTEYEGSLDDLFRDDLEKFITYNIQDVRIVVELDKKLNLIDLVRNICHLGHVPYEDYFMSSRYLEGTIVTYLHRRGIIVTDKPKDGREKMEEMKENAEEGFEGAYVKEPIPGLYDWVYSLDLQSLYPSVIMSLNISPETKVGYVRNWNIEQHNKKQILAYVVEEVGNNNSMEMEYESFMKFLEESNLTISSNGVLYTNDKRGIIPEILEVWFAQRLEFKALMKKAAAAGDTVQAAYYDRRQHIQKIFLNSMYGVLGLPVFRFYDVDNAESVTLSGQEVIKISAKVGNMKYEKLGAEKKDHCIYIDTDSLYFSAVPLLGKYYTAEGASVPQDEIDLSKTIQIAKEMESELNAFYDKMALRLFNCKVHRFCIKGESVAKTGLWIRKKRYALDKVYDLESDKPTDKLIVKGLDAVRSSFPKAFREFTKKMLLDILKRVPKDILDVDILEFKASLPGRHYLEVARNTSANNVDEYARGAADGLNKFRKGTPIHVKASIVYNRLLTHYGIEHKYERIADGAKIKYVYLKDNPLHIDVVAVRGYRDPKQIMQLITDYIDTDALFDNELRKKLQDFYTALGWGNIPTEVNQNASEWFTL